MPEIDRSVCIANIHTLCKARNIKISELETMAGVSAGYFSRLSRPENKSIPSVEVLDAVAKALGVLVDDLIHFNLGSTTPTDEYVLRLMDFLRQTAHNGEKHWRKLNAQQVYELDCNNYGEYCGPLFVDIAVVDQRETVFNSAFVDTMKCPQLQGYCYLLDLDGSKTIYLLQQEYGAGANRTLCYEMYVREGRDVHPLCSGIQGEEPGIFDRKIIALYNAVAESCSHTHITPDVKEALDILMGLKRPKSQESSSFDDLPF